MLSMSFQVVCPDRFVTLPDQVVTSDEESSEEALDYQHKGILIYYLPFKKTYGFLPSSL